MIGDKKIELVYCNNKFVSFRIGYSLGTVYTMSVADYHKFELFNFEYCPSTKDFYYNKNIH